MRLTKKLSRSETIELWEYLAKTGSEKEDWDGWEKWGGFYNIRGECFLCEYDERHGEADCSTCPLQKKYGDCSNTYFIDWCGTSNVEARKKYARLLVEQLKSL